MSKRERTVERRTEHTERNTETNSRRTKRKRIGAKAASVKIMKKRRVLKSYGFR